MARDFNTPPLPLEAITLHPRHHRAALWWLGWVYRNLDAFYASLQRLSRSRSVHVTAALYLHVLPWLFLLTVVGNILFFHAGLLHSEWAKLAPAGCWSAASTEAALNLVWSLVFAVGLVV